MLKTRRGGKYSGTTTKTKGANIRGRKTTAEENKSPTYDFYNPRLGPRTIPAANREEAIKKAKELYGYSEKDLKRRNRK